MKKKISLGMLLPCLFLSGWVFSQTSIYLKLGDIKGESADKDHKDWIMITGFDQGVSFSGGMMGGGGTGKAKFSELKLTRKIDKATPILMSKAATGARFPDAILEMTGGDGKVFYIVKLSDVVLTSIKSSTECEPGCVTSEKLELSFGNISWEYRDKSGGSTKGGWDVKLNRGM